MAVEVQVERTALEKAISDAVQLRLYRTCFPEVAGVFVDHADVDLSGAKITAGSHGEIQAAVPIQVYLVSEIDLNKFENQEPPGALIPTGGIVATFSLAVNGTIVTLSLDGLHSEPPNKIVDALLAVLASAMPSLPGFDAAPVFTSLGLPSPVTAEVALTGNVVAVRFDPLGPSVPHLFGGQDWGLFVDSSAVVAFIRSSLSAFEVPGLSLTPRWTPAGNIPRVTVDVRFKPDLPSVLTFTATAHVGANLTLVSAEPGRLRATVDWSIDKFDAGPTVPVFLEKFVRGIADDLLVSFLNPSIVGGTKVDDHSFFFDRAMPPLSLGGALLKYGSLEADAAGMTMGGKVISIAGERKRLSFTLLKFGLPVWSGTCRELAKTGSGDPPKVLGISSVNSLASVKFSNYGSLCDVTLLDPKIAATFSNYLHLPPVGRGDDVLAIEFDMPALVGKGLTKDVKLILRTARGVRLINLEHPVIQVDSNGKVNFTTWYWKNCFQLTDDQRHVIDWVLGKEAGSGIDLQPKDHPNWDRQLMRGRGLEVQIVSLAGLDPGELLRFRSADHQVDVTADIEGSALVPVILSISEDTTSAYLERVNRKSVAGKFNVRGVSFFRSMTLASGRENRLEERSNGGATLERHFSDKTTHDVIGAGGIPLAVQISSKQGVQAAEAGNADLNPQPLPPKSSQEQQMTELFASAGARISGVRDIVAIPGFEAEPLAIARMADGSAILLQADSGGRTRVAGSFAGPVGPISTAGAWAMGSVTEKVLLFEVRRH